MAAPSCFRACVVFGLLFGSQAQWPGRSRGRPGDTCGPAPMELNLGPFMPQTGRSSGAPSGGGGGLNIMQAMVLEQLDMTELALLQMAFPGAIVPRQSPGRPGPMMPPPPGLRRPPGPRGGPPPPGMDGMPPRFPPQRGRPRLPPAPANAPPPFGRPPSPPGRGMVRPPPGPPPADVFARQPNPPRNLPPRSPSSFAGSPDVVVERIPFRPQPGRSPVPVFRPGGRRPPGPPPPSGSPRPRPPFMPPPRTSLRRRPPMPPPRRSSGGGGLNPYMVLMMDQLDIPDMLLPFAIQSATTQSKDCYCQNAASCGQAYGRPDYGYSHECDGRFNLVCCCY